MEPGRFKMTAHVRDNRIRFSRQRYGRMRHQPIHVIDPEADPFEVERADRAIERFPFLD